MVGGVSVVVGAYVRVSMLERQKVTGQRVCVDGCAWGCMQYYVVHPLRGPGDGHCAHTAAPLHADGKDPSCHA